MDRTAQTLEARVGACVNLAHDALRFKRRMNTDVITTIIRIGCIDVFKYNHIIM